MAILITNSIKTFLMRFSDDFKDISKGNFKIPSIGERKG